MDRCAKCGGPVIPTQVAPLPPGERILCADCAFPVPPNEALALAAAREEGYREGLRARGAWDVAWLRTEGGRAAVIAHERADRGGYEGVCDPWGRRGALWVVAEVLARYAAQADALAEEVERG